MTTEEASGSNPTALLSRLTEPNEWKLGWAPQLDGLRAVATVMVMTVHYLHGFEKYLASLSISVDIFFAMSGFLITSLLFAEMDRKQTLSLRKFYIRRAIRLFPALYVLLGVFVVYAVVGGGADRSHYLAEAAAVFLYVYNFFIAWVGVNGNALVQLWTLSIEQQFYLVWPLFFIFAFKPRSNRGLSPLKMRMVVGLMITMVVVLPVLRMTLPQEMGARTLTSFMFGVSILRPDAVVLGCLAAFAMRIWSDRSSSTREAILSRTGDIALVIIIAAILLGPFEAFQRYVSPFYNLATLACAVWVFDLIRNPDKPVARLLRHKPLVWIGERTYGMYIWHLILFFVIEGFIQGLLPGHTRVVQIVALPFTFAATMLFAMASWRFVEQPAMKLRKRFGV